MTDAMLARPDVTEYRWALYAGGHLLDLTDTPSPPICLYRDELSARLHGARMWPSTFIIVDLAGDDRV